MVIAVATVTVVSGGDVVGGGSEFVALPAPVRLLDTRTGTPTPAHDRGRQEVAGPVWVAAQLVEAGEGDEVLRCWRPRSSNTWGSRPTASHTNKWREAGGGRRVSGFGK